LIMNIWTTIVDTFKFWSDPLGGLLIQSNNIIYALCFVLRHTTSRRGKYS
jgi:hypothetical protein